MAGPITHISFALQVLGAGLLPGINERDFIVGVTFPDIRVMAGVPKEVTHPQGVTWRDVVEEKDAFQAGVKLHVLIDQAVEENLLDNGYWQAFAHKKGTPEYTYFWLFLKYDADKLLWPFVSKKIQAIKHYFDAVLWQEEQFCEDNKIDVAVVTRWHEQLKFYGCRLCTLSEYLTITPQAHDLTVDQAQHYLRYVELVLNKNAFGSVYFNFPSAVSTSFCVCQAAA